MSSNSNLPINDLIPENYPIPEEQEQLLIKLYQYFNSLAMVINTKPNGSYIDQEVLTDKQFIPTFSTDTSSNIKPRDVFRVVVDTGALPNSGTSTTAHGITLDSNSSVISIYGGATDPNTDYIPLPYVVVGGTNGVEVSMDTTNINIKTKSNYSAYTRSFVIVEYIKQT
jgi:hypothetical protein